MTLTRKRTPTPFARVSWSDRQIRHHGADSLDYAMSIALATQADVAKWLGRSVRFVGKALKKQADLTLADLLKSGRLRPHMLRYLDACDRKVKKTLPRVARARRAR